MLKVVQKRKQCEVVVLDFSKAFDKVLSDRLPYKLDWISIDAETGNWIRSFLPGRTLKAVIDREDSEAVPVMSGVCFRTNPIPNLH